MEPDTKRALLVIAALTAAAGLGAFHYYPSVGASLIGAALLLALNTTLPPRK